jgi:hypothetical protein
MKKFIKILSEAIGTYGKLGGEFHIVGTNKKLG